MTIKFDTPDEAFDAFKECWSEIEAELKGVQSRELYYHALIYHILRHRGLPKEQIATNVKMDFHDEGDESMIKIKSDGMKELRMRKKNKEYETQFEPDIILLKKDVGGKWRREDCVNVIKNALLFIEVKLFEGGKRKAVNAQTCAIRKDIRKLETLKSESSLHNSGFTPKVCMVVIDVSDNKEEATSNDIKELKDDADSHGVEFLYAPRILKCTF